jgi:hypothetical protein
VSAPSGAARSCLPSYEHRASAVLIRDYGVIAQQCALSDVTYCLFSQVGR